MASIEGATTYALIPDSDLLDCIRDGKIRGATLAEGIPQRLFEHLEAQTQADNHEGIGNLIHIADAKKILNSAKRLELLLGEGIEYDNESDDPEMDVPKLDSYAFLELGPTEGHVHLKEKATLIYNIPKEYDTKGEGFTIGPQVIRRDALREVREFLESFPMQPRNTRALPKKAALTRYAKGKLPTHLIDAQPLVLCYGRQTIAGEDNHIEVVRIELGVYIEERRKTQNQQSGSHLFNRVIGSGADCCYLVIGGKKMVARFPRDNPFYNVAIFTVMKDSTFVREFPLALKFMIDTYQPDEFNILKEAVRGFPDSQNRETLIYKEEPPWFQSLVNMYLHHRQKRYETRLIA